MGRLGFSDNVFGYEVGPEAVPDFSLRFESSLSRLVGGFASEARFNRDLNITRYTVTLEGAEVQILVAYASDGVVLVDPPTAALGTRLKRLLAEAKPQYHTGVVHLSLGFSSTGGLIDLGDLLLAPLAAPRRHSMRTGPGTITAGPVHDHVSVFAVQGYSPMTASSSARAMAQKVAALVSFVLRHPVAVIGEGQALEATLGDGRMSEDLRGCLSGLNAVGEPPTALEHAPGPTVAGWPKQVVPVSNAVELYDIIRQLHDDDGYLAIEDCLRSYAKAMLLANPEPGFDRYKDTGLAITLWTTIAERLSDPPVKQPPCPECGRPRETSARSRVKSLAAQVQPNLDPKRLDRIRGVRHKTAHDARPVRDSIADRIGRFSRPDDDLLLQGLQEAHDLAHAALTRFVLHRRSLVPPAP